MTAFNTLTLAAMTLVFAVWAVLMFVMLFRLNRAAQQRKQEARAGILAGFGITLATFRDFAFASEFRRDRRRLLAVTALLFALILARAFLVGAN